MPPNILIITTDQHNAEIAGFAGNPVVRTPNLDALAAEGTVFDQAFTPWPLCTPARTSIFSGLWPKHHKVRYNVNMNYRPGGPGLAPERTAFPEVLQQAGYNTAFFGKLHTRHEGGKNFGHHLMRLVEGKCHFVPSPDAEDEYRRYLREKGYPPGAWKVWENDPSYRENGFVTSPFPLEDYVDTFIARMATEHLERVQPPFYAWVSFCSPHNPWDPPAPFDTMIDPAAIPMPHRKEGELEKKPRKWVDMVARTIPALPATSMDPDLPGGVENAYRRFPEERTRRMLAAYYGQVCLVDSLVGRLMEVLRARGLYDDTVVIFTSDHGDYCGNNWAFYKYQGLYDSLIRVPLVVRWPGMPGSRRVRDLVSLIDIAPTVVEAAGGVPPPEWDGRSLRPLVAGETVPWRDQLIVEDGTNALLTPEWKYILWPDGTEELYDRQRDPHDLDNLADEPGLEAVRAELRRRLEDWLAAP